MKKGKITITITIGLVMLILTAVMFIQFKTVKQTDFTSLENMREDELRTGITNFKQKTEETNKRLEEVNAKIAEYEQTIESNTEASEVLAKELEQFNNLLGKNDVKGEGVVITLTDTRNQRIWSEDLRLLVNELKEAGAEAISINDQRIVYDTYIVDISNTHIRINGQEMIVSPYVVKAIGNPTYLESGLSKKQYGYIDTKLAEGKDVIMEGRDIGTYVFPNADVKIYLDAEPEERARRRQKQNEEAGIQSTYEEVLAGIIARDENDKNKEMGALKVAKDAIVVDGTHGTIEENVQKVIDIINKKKQKNNKIKNVEVDASVDQIVFLCFDLI